MAFLAMCMPILIRKMEKWQGMMDHIKSTPDFAASRKEAGVHERSFVQNTPAGDFLIITLEGEDPSVSWAKIAQSMSQSLLNLRSMSMV
jgi:hypothetical protein